MWVRERRLILSSTLRPSTPPPTPAAGRLPARGRAAAPRPAGPVLRQRRHGGGGVRPRQRAVQRGPGPPGDVGLRRAAGRAGAHGEGRGGAGGGAARRRGGGGGRTHPTRRGGGGGRPYPTGTDKNLFCPKMTKNSFNYHFLHPICHFLHFLPQIFSFYIFFFHFLQIFSAFFSFSLSFQKNFQKNFRPQPKPLHHGHPHPPGGEGGPANPPQKSGNPTPDPPGGGRTGLKNGPISDLLPSSLRIPDSCTTPHPPPSQTGSQNGQQTGEQTGEQTGRLKHKGSFLARQLGGPAHQHVGAFAQKGVQHRI